MTQSYKAELSEAHFTYQAKMQLGPDSALIKNAGGASIDFRGC